MSPDYDDVTDLYICSVYQLFRHKLLQSSLLVHLQIDVLLTSDCKYTETLLFPWRQLHWNCCNILTERCPLFFFCLFTTRGISHPLLKFYTSVEHVSFRKPVNISGHLLIQPTELLITIGGINLSDLSFNIWLWVTIQKTISLLWQSHYYYLKLLLKLKDAFLVIMVLWFYENMIKIKLWFIFILK